MGHADEKKKDKPHTITPLEQVNIECDKEAGIVNGSPAPTPVPFKPLPGYKAMLRLDGQWITAHFRECVKFAHTSPALIAYIIRRLEISPATFELIDWRSIGRVRSTHGFSLKVRISKMMYRWLAVGHNWRKCNLTTDKCPCCGEPDKTYLHLYQCANDRMKKAKSIAYTNFHRTCKDAKVPPFFVTVFMKALRVAHEGAPPPRADSPEVATAYDDQANIGFHNMAVRFLAKSWITLLQILGVNHPESMMETIISALWDDICCPIWIERNNIKHSRDNCLVDTEMADLSDRLLWYLRHRDNVLDYRHRFLADFKPDDIRRWSRASRQAKLETLNNARDYYEVKCQQKARNQTTIITWLHQSKELCSGRMIGEGLRNAWAFGRRPAQQNHTNDQVVSEDETEEAEFEWEPSSSNQLNKSNNDQGVPKSATEEAEFEWESSISSNQLNESE